MRSLTVSGGVGETCFPQRGFGGQSPQKKLLIIGCGPGGRDYLCPAARKGAEKAQVIIGPERLLDLFHKVKGMKKIFNLEDFKTLWNQIEGFWKEGREVVVLLVSGDPGFYSLARLAIERFGRERCEVVPGVSSFQLAFARLGLNWDDAILLSAHGRPLDEKLLQSIKRSKKAALLTDHKNTPQKVAQALLKLGASKKVIYVCSDLSGQEEKIEQYALESLAVSIEESCIKSNLLIILEDALEKAIVAAPDP